MELLSNVQVPTILFLQKFRVYALPLLVRVFLWIQCSSELFDLWISPTNSFQILFQTVFDPMFISVYNLFYTSLPVLGLGIFEQDVSDKHSLEYPKLYTPGLTNALFNTREFVKSVIHGVFSSLVLFLIPYGENFDWTECCWTENRSFDILGTYRDLISPEGHTLNDHMLLGSVVATILILDNTTQVFGFFLTSLNNHLDMISFRSHWTRRIGRSSII